MSGPFVADEVMVMTSIWGGCGSPWTSHPGFCSQAMPTSGVKMIEAAVQRGMITENS